MVIILKGWNRLKVPSVDFTPTHLGKNEFRHVSQVTSGTDDMLCT